MGRKGEPTIDSSVEADLVAAFVAREHDALERAYRSYGRLLYSVARQVLVGDAEAQDCVHDALLRVWQRPETFRPERGSLRAFLTVCVRNEAIGRKRSAARHFTIEQRLVENEGDVRYEFEIEDHAELAHLRHALGTLPAEQRRALELAPRRRDNRCRRTRPRRSARTRQDRSLVRRRSSSRPAHRIAPR